MEKLGCFTCLACYPIPRPHTRLGAERISSGSLTKWLSVIILSSNNIIGSKWAYLLFSIESSNTCASCACTINIQSRISTERIWITPRLFHNSSRLEAFLDDMNARKQNEVTKLRFGSCTSISIRVSFVETATNDKALREDPDWN